MLENFLPEFFTYRMTFESIQLAERLDMRTCTERVPYIVKEINYLPRNLPLLSRK